MNELDCPVELLDGKWTCPQCGWVYPLPAQDDPPRRNCPRAPNGIDRVLAAVARRLADTPFDLPEVRIRICWDCAEFNGRTCTERGSACKHFERWIERLSFGGCEVWG